jgi:hypothetical protein
MILQSEEEDKGKGADNQPKNGATEFGAASPTSTTLPVASLGITGTAGSIEIMLDDDGSSSQLRMLAHEL